MLLVSMMPAEYCSGVNAAACGEGGPEYFRAPPLSLNGHCAVTSRR